jgi:hypothetical protein
LFLILQSTLSGKLRPVSGRRLDVSRDVYFAFHTHTHPHVSLFLCFHFISQSTLSGKLRPVSGRRLDVSRDAGYRENRTVSLRRGVNANVNNGGGGGGGGGKQLRRSGSNSKQSKHPMSLKNSIGHERERLDRQNERQNDRGHASGGGGSGVGIADSTRRLPRSSVQNTVKGTVAPEEVAAAASARRTARCGGNNGGNAGPEEAALVSLDGRCALLRKSLLREVDASKFEEVHAFFKRRLVGDGGGGGGGGGGNSSSQVTSRQLQTDFGVDQDTIFRIEQLVLYELLTTAGGGAAVEKV